MSHILITNYDDAVESKQIVFWLGYGLRGQDLDGQHVGHVLDVTIHTLIGSWPMLDGIVLILSDILST